MYIPGPTRLKMLVIIGYPKPLEAYISSYGWAKRHFGLMLQQMEVHTNDTTLELSVPVPGMSAWNWVRFPPWLSRP